MVYNIISRMKEVDTHIESVEAFAKKYPESYGAEAMPDRDAMHREIIDDCDAELIKRHSCPGVMGSGISHELHQVVDGAMTTPVLPTKLDHERNIKVQKVAELDLLNEDDFFTGNYQNSRVWKATKEAVIWGLSAGIVTSLAMGGVFAADFNLSYVNGIKAMLPIYCIGFPAIFASLGFLSNNKREANFADAEYLDGRIEDLYHSIKASPESIIED